MKSIRLSLHTSLSTLFLETLRALQVQHNTSGGPTLAIGQKEEQRQRLADCLRVYDLVEGWRDAEDVVRSLVRESIAQVRFVKFPFLVIWLTDDVRLPPLCRSSPFNP
jgi:hypothetical protein